MKKLILIMAVLFLIGCNDSSSKAGDAYADGYADALADSKARQ